MPRKIPNFVWLLVFLLCVLPTFAQNTQKRVALVIGNSEASLNSPSSDAGDIANALKELGFEVLLGTNQNREKMAKLIDDFTVKLTAENSVGLFYYAGYGLQINGVNYLMPVNVDLSKNLNLEEILIPFDGVLSKISASNNSQNILFLDTKHSFLSLSLNPSIYQIKLGLSKVSAPPGTVLLYSTDSDKNAREKCGRNSLFAEAILKFIKKPQFEFENFVEAVTKEVSDNSARMQTPWRDGRLSGEFYFNATNDVFSEVDKTSLEYLYTSYQRIKKCRCGFREEAIPVAKMIIEKYGDDKDNSEVAEFVKKDIAKIEKDETYCRRSDRYDSSYKAKDWSDFFAISKLIIEQDSDKGLVLDVILTLVSVGYDRAAVDKVDTFNNDTLNYAKKAIQQLESGTNSKTNKYGVFVPFTTKENALSWMNYIIGWQMYNKMNQKKDALAYIFKSTQLGNEKKNDITIYTTIGAYYFDEAVRLDTQYREKRKANKNEDNDETKALLGLARGTAARAIDAFGRAYKIAIQSKSNQNLIDAIKKTLDDLYRFRFNIPPGVKPEGVEIYFEKLISQPMPDPSTKVEAVLQ